MSERGRGRGGGGRGSSGPSRGGGAAGGAGSGSRSEDRPKREAILDLNNYVNKEIRIKFAGGREVKGTLKGFDQLLNLVMDDVQEFNRDVQTGLAIEPDQYRKLGLVVVRGTSIVLINPVEGSESISNPFV